MTRAELLRLARQAGFQTGCMYGADGAFTYDMVVPAGRGCVVELERFAALVAEWVREQDGGPQGP